MRNLKKRTIVNLVIIFLLSFTLVKANSASNNTKLPNNGFKLCQDDTDNQNPSDIYQEPDNGDNSDMPQQPPVTPQPPDSDTDNQ